ncbi:flagellar basal body rod protein FlgG [Metabacillus sp. KIGAM252]|uniref:Flagellar basal body rod protein FlgG n=1 Tax=Metabacillus flavus TaxID=2823519 RepID=A0ABS5LE29_9BACI|nr:flagellar basal body rod protein FlgG [Metabacillus flavus]MBS2968990.1 flagellar basal body rod protein FlgG [Metabacillus flavus]
MLRSLYSGISGMKNFQTKLDVIGNNISNVNTYGFKKGRTIFQDLYSQSITGASAPAGTMGGTNPSQVGLGSQLASIDTIHTGGSLQTTGRNLDLAISGDGFFQVAESGKFASPFYTRAGNFYLDNQGDIVTSEGLYLKSTGGAKITIPTTAKSMSVGQDGNVSYVDSAGAIQTAGTIQLAKFPNVGGLEKTGSNLYIGTTNSGTAVLAAPGQSGTGLVQAGSLEMSNVDLSEEFTEMIVAQRGFQSNTKIITTSDEILQELMNLKR